MLCLGPVTPCRKLQWPWGSLHLPSQGSLFIGNVSVWETFIDLFSSCARWEHQSGTSVPRFWMWRSPSAWCRRARLKERTCWEINGAWLDHVSVNTVDGLTVTNCYVLDLTSPQWSLAFPLTYGIKCWWLVYQINSAGWSLEEFDLHGPQAGNL
jgi:hypothetical protein